MKEQLPKVQRRNLLAVAGLAGIPGLLPMAAAAAENNSAPEALSPAEAENLRIVNAYCQAWSTLDVSKPFEFLSDDCIYRMSESTPPVIGHKGVAGRLEPSVVASSKVEFHVLEAYARGPLVINHRIDTFVSKTLPLVWEGVGVFYLKDDKIKEWSDYTIRFISRQS